ncbi:unnamed protein product [Arabis nemorensis]|uniref:Uncharacterized protein n=1 Tax=Arabis nemorensis TaxID=586526 RepID=A0A565B6L2_9BRAS|nr:unnamed protein product [Arabis nemorensis]
MDTGNNNNLPTFLKCNFPPYDKDFIGGLAIGRFSDGRVPSDLIDNLAIYLAQSHRYDRTSYANFLADSAVKFVRELHKLGARKIGVFSAMPVGCVPIQRTVFGGIFRRGCVKPLNNMAKQFNSRLFPALDSLDKELDGIILDIDVYDTLFDMIQHPKKYGSEVSDKGCCGVGSLVISYMCNTLNPVNCYNSLAYVFWDSYHPTERAYQMIVDKLLNKY